MKVEKLVEHGLPREYVETLLQNGIDKLNPVQKQAVERGLFTDKNIVVVAPTASGKTLVGEMALVKKAYEKKIGLYLVPLRALASEKYYDFKKLEKLGFRIGISTGDYESPAEYLGRYDIIVATYERFDSLLRLKPSWLRRIGIVVIDELHMIGDDERGPILEMIIARLLRTNIQVIGLSATIGNPLDLAKWIDAELVDVPYRPVKLVEGIYDRKKHKILFMDGREEKIVHRIGNAALNIALQSISAGIQVLVFVHNRRKTEEWAYKLTEHLGLFRHLIDKRKVDELLKKLKESPSRVEREKLEYLIKRGVAYHHAGLSNIARKVVEEGFRNRVIRIVFATPTLAAGVNLPARRVLVSIKRYSPLRRKTVNIPIYEYKQMAGRAGRPKFDPFGEAIIYDANNNTEAMKYIRSPPEPIYSKLNNERSLRIHTLSLIASGDANEMNELMQIYKNTLFYNQYGNLENLKLTIDKVLDELAQWEMIRFIGDKEFYATSIGIITSKTYLDPLSVNMFIKNLPEKPREFYLLFLITMTPDYMRSKPYINSRLVDYYENEAIILAEDNIIPKPENFMGEYYDYYMYKLWAQAFVHAKMLHDWINEVDEDTISEKYGIGPGDIYSARDTASWIAGALSKVAQTMNLLGLGEALDKLSIRLEYGVKEDALELIKLQGIGRVRARTLINHGIRTLKDLAKTPPSILEKLPGFGPRIVKSIYEQLEILKIK
ncbi:MAG: DEAD/DEAH box helicase [Thermoprotei archaeon]|nr:MAG: DEAD/DEAH box helicase [Thermoprotei archaeon]